MKLYTYNQKKLEFNETVGGTRYWMSVVALLMILSSVIIYRVMELNFNSNPNIVHINDTCYKEINPYTLKLTPLNLIKEIHRNKIYFPKIVFKQALL